MSCFISSIVAFVSLLALAPAFHYLPYCALSAIIIASVVNLIDVHEFFKVSVLYWARGWV